MIPCSYRASTCNAALPSYMALYAISVRQTRGLPVVSLFPHPASFRFHLVMDTLAFGYILPTTGRIRDFHPLETCAARRTLIKKSRELTLLFFYIHAPLARCDPLPPLSPLNLFFFYIHAPFTRCDMIWLMYAIRNTYLHPRTFYKVRQQDIVFGDILLLYPVLTYWHK